MRMLSRPPNNNHVMHSSFSHMGITEKVTESEHLNFFSSLTAVPSHRPEDDDFDMEEELRKLHPQRFPHQAELEPRSRRVMVGDPRVSVIHEGRGPGESEEESDSDGPILYRDDDDDDDEEGPPSKLVFAILAQKFSLAEEGQCFVLL